MRAPEQWTQYNMGISSIYSHMDETTLELTGWELWQFQNHIMDAPEFIPIGSSRRHMHKDGFPYVQREPMDEEERAIVDALIDEILNEQKKEKG